MKEATEFLKNLRIAQWHNLNDIPTDLKDSVWDIIDGNSLDGYRFYIHEEYDYLYMKLKDAAKEQLKMDINQVIRDWERYRDWETDRKSTRLNSSHSGESRMPSSA